MDIRADLRAMEARLRSYIDQRVANVAQLSPVSLATSDGLADGVTGPPAEEDSQRQVRRIQHAGFRSRPLEQALAVTLAAEGSSTKLVQIAEDDGLAGQVPLEEGETAIYSPKNPGCRAWFDKDGKLHIDGRAGDLPQDVIVNGGTAKVSRVGDHTSGHIHTATFALTAPSGGGAVTGTITIASATDSMAEGADNFKA
jgi:phage gp45-like